MTMSFETIENMIDKTGVSLISSVDEDGFPNTKAMLPPRKREGLKHFYFTTNTSSIRVKQYEKNNKACIYFFDKRYFRGVMLTGTMEVCHDPETKQLIWRDGDTLYYPLGVTDPDYCVLKFTALKLRQYQNFRSVTMEIPS
jgi:general stress protein 26